MKTATATKNGKRENHSKKKKSICDLTSQCSKIICLRWHPRPLSAFHLRSFFHFCLYCCFFLLAANRLRASRADERWRRRKSGRGSRCRQRWPILASRASQRVPIQLPAEAGTTLARTNARPTRLQTAPTGRGHNPSPIGSRDKKE